MRPIVEQRLLAARAAQREPLCAYLYDLAVLRDHVADVLARLPRRCKLYYAMKANPARPILETLAPLVDGFEVASLGEVAKARQVAADKPIMFGGPGKTDAELAGALRQGVRQLHVESLHELRRLDQLGREQGARVPILLRVNLRGPFPSATLHMGGTTQFGIDEAAMPEAIALAQTLAGVDLRGFHYHTLSNQHDPAAHVDLIAYYLRRSQAWAREFALPLHTLNVGGGIGVNYAELDQQFDWPTFTGRLASLLSQELPPETELLFECGRYLVASCGYYACEVLDIKQNHGKDYVIVRGGTHQFRLPSSWQQSHPFTVLPLDAWPYPFVRPEVCNRPITVVGQLCTPKDVLARDQVVPRIRAGDLVVFQYAGAYGWTISHHDFLSHPHPEQIFEAAA